VIPGGIWPRHGGDGYKLESYSWDEETGVATFGYSHPEIKPQWDGYSSDDGLINVVRLQPATPAHAGWSTRQR
jgi:hypothetical protein